VTLSSLLTFAPKCDAIACRKRAVVRLGLTHPRWKQAQRADLCGGHEAGFIKAAGTEAITMVVEHRWGRG
jgi:hypothetical protein